MKGLDYFCQTKIFYRITDTIDVTNCIYFFPFTGKDIDIQKIQQRLDMVPEKHKKYKHTNIQKHKTTKTQTYKTQKHKQNTNKIWMG